MKFEKIVIKASDGTQMTSGEDGLYVNANDLRDYEWEVTNTNWRVNSVKKNFKARQIPLVIFGNSESEATAKKNEFFAMVEKDTVNETPTRIYIGDFYLEGYVIKSTKSNYNSWKRFLSFTIEYAPTYPYWIKEQEKDFGAQVDNGDRTGLDFPFDFEFDFTGDISGVSFIDVPHYTSSHAEIIINGPCVNPSVVIGENEYKVYTQLEDGEYLIIRTRDKTVYKRLTTGQLVNLFNSRSKEKSIFEKISAGSSPISWTGGFGWSLKVFIERSEPEWT